MDKFEFGSHPFQAVGMHVDRPGSEIVSSGQGDPSHTTTGKQWAEDDDRSSHLTDQIDRRLGIELLRHDDKKLVAILSDHTTGMGEDLAHQLDVENAGHIGETVAPRGEQTCDHLLEDRILRTEHPNCAFETGPTFDHKMRHHAEDSDLEAKTLSPTWVVRGGLATLPPV
jgi:hypothetical protein